MRPQTILAAVVAVSLALVAHCATRSRSAMAPEEPAGPAAAAAPESDHPASEMEASASAQNAPVVPVVSDDPFVANVRPILATRCAPCHNPGGKMYARLPFDDSKVVASNSPGILRRLKGDDRAAVEKWLAQLTPPSEVQSPK